VKVLIHSNSPWAPTGYGSQVRLIAPALAEHHEVAISSFYGLEGARLNWDGITVYPGLGGEFGNGYLVDHAREHFDGDPRGGIVFTLLDVWVMDPNTIGQLNVASWVPVDHDPVPPAVHRYFQESSAAPVAMSRFGQEQLADFDALYVPHAVDTATFHPQSQRQVRDAVGIDRDSFIVGIVAANKGRPSRKCFSEALQAFAVFRRRHEEAKLYLHTVMDPNHAQGEPLAELMVSLELPEDSVLVADQYRQMFNPQPPRNMAAIYSTFDVLLNATAGEGFGIPIMEAQACGVPTIVTDFSAMKEVGANWKVGCRPQWTAQKSWQAAPLVEDIVGALEECHAQTDEQKQESAAKARKHAMAYDIAQVTEAHLLPALRECAERFEARKPEVLEPIAA
jgi:glycosyltransferase involved in cell wall biosynthesis